MAMDVSIYTIVFISLTGIVTGAMGAIIGSTLLILVPLLGFFGLPIQTAIGTAKISVVGREIIPAFYFHARKVTKPSLAIPFSISAVITSGYGSMVAISLPAAVLEKIVAVFMIIISLILLLNPNIGLQAKALKMTWVQVIICILLGTFVGFYTGIYGGGANVFIILGFVFIFGNSFLQAAANSKVPNLIITLASLPLFIYRGFVNWEIAVPLTLSTALGSYFGAKLAVDRGSRFIRNL